jgi:hypothetical protein
LEEDNVGLILGQGAIKLREELALMEHVGVCFKLSGPKLERPVFLFPSLTSHADTITFSSALEKGVDSDLQYSGIRFTLSRNQLIFVPGFFCQLIVSLFEKLNLSKRELGRIHNNGAVVSCSGLLLGN